MAILAHLCPLPSVCCFSARECGEEYAAKAGKLRQYQVVVNRYAHAGSMAERLHSWGLTKEAAETLAASLTRDGMYRFAVVQLQDVPITYSNLAR